MIKLNKVNILFTIGSLLTLYSPVKCQTDKIISLDDKLRNITGEHLQLGGVNPHGRAIEVNNYYLSIDGQPNIPVTGEFHFSRYPEKYWEESIQKMRAGGISVIATYVFWNIHEEKEGVYNWEGDNNLRKFIKLCANYNFDVIVRIGPFCHGEIRNGGLPDWLLGKPLSIRSNHPLYLQYVERLYEQIGEQLDGYLFKDGGPVIGIQLENEYQHSASPWGLTYPGQPHDYTVSERDRKVTQIGVGVAREKNPYEELGNDHLKVLKSIAEKAGINVPLYTVTGWGNAAIIENETLPVTAAYPYPTWAPEEPSEFYLYTNLQKDPDYSPVRYQAENYPCMAAELGGGIMNTYERRPIVPAESLDPMINRFLGSGANGIGYYMYHGGSTPRGDRDYFSDVAVGCPIISYDFQAPIGEFGQVKPSFHRLKLLHYFLNSFGDILAPMPVILPENQVGLSPLDDTTLRYSIRALDGSGFIFMNNFQDHHPSIEKKDIRFTLQTGDGEMAIPEKGFLKLQEDEHAILPFNLDINGVLLNYATTQLLTKGEGPNQEFYIFFSIPGIEPEYSFSKGDGLQISQEKGCKVVQSEKGLLVQCNSGVPAEFEIISARGQHTRILTVPRRMAMESYTVGIGENDHLIFSESLVLSGNKGLDLISFNKEEFDIAIYPVVKHKPGISQGRISLSDHPDPLFSSFRIELPSFRKSVELKQIQSNKFSFTLPTQLPDQCNDLFLLLDYYGDTGMGFLEGELVADHFFNGTNWIIGLKKFINFGEKKEMVLYFRPMYPDAPFRKDLETNGFSFPENESGFKLNKAELLTEYKATLIF